MEVWVEQIEEVVRKVNEMAGKDKMVQHSTTLCLRRSLEEGGGNGGYSLE